MTAAAPLVGAGAGVVAVEAVFVVVVVVVAMGARAVLPAIRPFFVDCEQKRHAIA